LNRGGLEIFTGNGPIINNENTCIWNGSGQNMDGTYYCLLVLTSNCSGEEIQYGGSILVLNGDDDDTKTLIMKKTKQDFIQVYPNPNKGKCILSIDNNKDPINIEIYNSLGEGIFNRHYENENDYNIDLSAFPDGIYTLKVKLEDQIFIEKIIKQ
jgi:hypothetical protein